MMKSYVPYALVGALCLALMCALSVDTSAQYLVSSKAGFVNRADGKVMILRADSEDAQAGRASLGTQMREGDRLSTLADARAEILLNPGSYLRLDQNSEVRAVMTSFDETRFELIKGSIIVEIGKVDKNAAIEIATPNGVVSIAKDGLMRIDAKNAATWVAVRQGEIFLGPRELALAGRAENVKRGKLVRLTGDVKPELAKVDKDHADNFDSWSFVRAQTLVQANLAALQQNTLLSQQGWFYNSFYGCYTFMPGRRYLVSPYGFGFFSNWADCYWYSPFSGGLYGYGFYPGYNTGGGATAPNVPARVIAGVDRDPIRREVPGERGIISTGNESGFGRYDSSVGTRSIDAGRSVSSAPAAAPVIIAAPAPTRSDSGSSSLPTRGGGNNN